MTTVNKPVTPAVFARLGEISQELQLTDDPKEIHRLVFEVKAMVVAHGGEFLASQALADFVKPNRAKIAIAVQIEAQQS